MTSVTFVLDNRDQVFTRDVHTSEVDLRKYIANRDEYLYYDITSQAEKEFDTIIHQDCLRRQDEARKAHFLEQGFPRISAISPTRWYLFHMIGRNELQIPMPGLSSASGLGHSMLQ